MWPSASPQDAHSASIILSCLTSVYNGSLWSTVQRGRGWKFCILSSFFSRSNFDPLVTPTDNMHLLTKDLGYLDDLERYISQFPPMHRPTQPLNWSQVIDILSPRACSNQLIYSGYFGEHIPRLFYISAISVLLITMTTLYQMFTHSCRAPHTYILDFLPLEWMGTL